MGVLSCYNANMKELQYKPKGFWRLDDTAPFQDYSGYNNNATLSGTESHGISLSSEAVYSQKLTSTVIATFPSSVYKAGKENDSFSLSATVHMYNSGGDHQILGSAGKNDGLTINGSVVSFSTKYVNQGYAKCSYDLGAHMRVDIVGIHTSRKNSLYVNGRLVAEIEITPAQQNDTFDSGTNLSSGTGPAGSKLFINNVAVFDSALTENQVREIHEWNSRTAFGDVAKMYGGDSVLVSSLVRPTFIDESFNGNWDSGVFSGASIDGDSVVAEIVGGFTSSSSWETSIPLGDGENLVSLDSGVVFYSGTNVVVEASLDGTSWTTVESGKPLPLIATGQIPSNAVLLVRASFVGGQVFASLNSLRVIIYRTNTVNTNGSTITYTQPLVVRDEYQPRDLRDDWGVTLYGGSLSVTPPAASRTVEVWLKPEGAINVTVPAGTVYSNGGAQTALEDGQWQLRTYVLSADTSAPIVISGDGVVGMVSFYPTALSATDVANVYASYTGIRKFVTSENNSIGVTEPATVVDIYTHDWQIVAS